MCAHIPFFSNMKYRQIVMSLHAVHVHMSLSSATGAIHILLQSYQRVCFLSRPVLQFRLTLTQQTLKFLFHTTCT